MECLRVGVTALTTHQRFTLMAEMQPFRRVAPLRARRMSTNEGPLFSTNLRSMQNHQDIVDDVVQQLGLDWRVQDLQQENHFRASSRPRSRSGSLPRSRDGSMSRNSRESEMPGLVRLNAWGNLSRANSIGNVSQQSGQSGRSSGGHSNHSQAMSFKGPDLNQRLQMRNAWMRQRNLRARGRGRGRGRGGYIQWNQQRGRWNNPQWRRGWQHGRQQWWRQQWGRAQGARRQQGWGRRRGNTQNAMPPLTPRGRAGLENPGYIQKRGFAGRGRGRARGRGRGRGGQNTGAPQNSMPGLKTKEQLDKELEEYMASTPASLDKELDMYMAQSGLTMDTE